MCPPTRLGLSPRGLQTAAFPVLYSGLSTFFIQDFPFFVHIHWSHFPAANFKDSSPLLGSNIAAGDYLNTGCSPDPPGASHPHTMHGPHTIPGLHITHHASQRSKHTYGTSAPTRCHPLGVSLITTWPHSPSFLLTAISPLSTSHTACPRRHSTAWNCPPWLPGTPESVCKETFLQGGTMFSNSEPQNLFLKAVFCKCSIHASVCMCSSERSPNGTQRPLHGSTTPADVLALPRMFCKALA